MKKTRLIVTEQWHSSAEDAIRAHITRAINLWLTDALCQ